MTDDDLQERLNRLEEQTEDDDGERTVLVIGGDAERAGVMTESEYLDEYSPEERERHISGGRDE